jgi:hypothetical protein
MLRISEAEASNGYNVTIIRRLADDSHIIFQI